MCGIAGYIDFTKKSTYKELTLMTDTLTHRGPDGSGYLETKTEHANIGFGHRRLSIIDLSPLGKQPMEWNGNQIVFNGEIYNYAEIRRTLIELGHSFISNSDTEVLIHAYQEWKEACLEKFTGMFAFVLFDNSKNEIFIARDRMGVKPLFYYWKDGLFLFASELKAFQQHSGFKKELNKNAIATYLQYGNVPTTSCIFKNTQKVQPGNWIKIDLSNPDVKQQQYWSCYTYYNRPFSTITFEEAKFKAKELIEKSCKYRMVSDVPVGVFLSGGYDSTLVTAILQKESKQALKTFTIAVEDSVLNEAPYALEIAKHLGTDHHQFTCTAKEALEVIPQLAEIYDEPFADSSAIPTFLVSKMAKTKVTVALSADGGDELFAGYNRYDYLAKYTKTIGRLPAIVQKTGAKLMQLIPVRHLPFVKNKYNFHNRYEKLKGLLRNSGTQNLMLSLSQQYFNNDLKEVLLFDFELEDGNYHKKNTNTAHSTPLREMMAIDLETYLVDDILQKVDRATMYAGIEGREPLLDHTLFEFAAQLPDEYKYKNGIKKHILKELVYDFVPQKIMERPKMGFAIPIGKWMRNELSDDIKYHLSENFLEKQKLFHPQRVQQIVNSFYGGRKEYELKVWYLYIFQLWYCRWITN